MTSIKLLSESRALIAPLTQSQDAAVKKVVDEAIRDVAAVDGDKVLDQFEAEAIKHAYDTAVPQGQALTADKVGAFKNALSLRIQEMKSERVKATEVIFTSEGQALEQFRGKILGSLQETIDRAGGKPVDVNMMLFAFTDKIMADAIVDMAKAHPEVNFRLLTDWSQLATSGDRQPPRLARIAEEQGLTNLQVKFKKDDPYVWSDSAKRPVYSHSKTFGLNHHKGFVTTIDGRPEKMTMGSFNWSVSAMKSNYENLMLLDRADPDNRRVMAGYQDEFAGFWNNDEVALTYNEARSYKNDLYAKMYADHNQPYRPTDVPDDLGTDPLYDASNKHAGFDINSFADEDSAKLRAVVGKTLAGKIEKELRTYGRFDCWTELLARVPDVAKASTWAREQLMENLDYGQGGLSINTATVAELDRAGLSRKQSEKIVAFREAHGAFENLDELKAIKGIGTSTVNRLRDVLTDDEGMGTYSASLPGGQATTGWSETHHGTMTVAGRGAVAGDEGGAIPANRDTVEKVERDMAAPVVDMLRRTQPGQTFRLALYGISPSSPEFKALTEAIDRGVQVRVVLYKSYNESAINALKKFKEQGKDVDLRIISSRVMHEKFGVVGDDSFNGSANWSSSS
ncbi:MAG: phospholipase D-like domain-containing protein, partial [Pseudomonadota bacterium]